MDRRISRSFGPSAAEAAAARHFAVSVLADWGLASADVELAVGELAANAIKHAGSVFSVTMSQRTDDAEHRRVTLEVADDSAVLPRMVVTTAGEQKGRGLWILDQIATAWGTRPAAPGKVVWAAFTID